MTQIQRSSPEYYRLKKEEHEFNLLLGQLKKISESISPTPAPSSLPQANGRYSSQETPFHDVLRQRHQYEIDQMVVKHALEQKMVDELLSKSLEASRKAWEVAQSRTYNNAKFTYQSVPIQEKTDKPFHGMGNMAEVPIKTVTELKKAFPNQNDQTLQSIAERLSDPNQTWVDINPPPLSSSPAHIHSPFNRSNSSATAHTLQQSLSSESTHAMQDARSSGTDTLSLLKGTPVPTSAYSSLGSITKQINVAKPVNEKAVCDVLNDFYVNRYGQTLQQHGISLSGLRLVSQGEVMQLPLNVFKALHSIVKYPYDCKLVPQGDVVIDVFPCTLNEARCPGSLWITSNHIIFEPTLDSTSSLLSIKLRIADIVRSQKTPPLHGSSHCILKIETNALEAYTFTTVSRNVEMFP